MLLPRTTLFLIAFFFAMGRLGVAGEGSWSVIATAPYDTNFQTMAIGRDHNVWTVDYYFQTIDRFTPSGARKTFSLGAFNPIGIALGSDGDFWINGLGAGNRLVRATPTGVIRYYNLPDGQPAYGGIVSGPGGMVWFTQETEIGSIAGDGHVLEYPSDGCSPAALGIAPGPDGRIWYGAACPGAPNDMFALDPGTTQLTGYAIPSNLLISPFGIVGAPDGALWFTSNQNGGYLGRITTTGTISRYRVLVGTHSAYSASVQNIAVGPNGHIWYIRDLGTASIVDDIDPFTLRVSRHVPPQGYLRMNSIIFGPDRRMWMTAGNQIYAFLP